MVYREEDLSTEGTMGLECSRIAIGDARKRDVLLNLFDFDCWFVAGVSARNDHDVPTFDFRNTVALITDGFDCHVAHFSLINRRTR